MTSRGATQRLERKSWKTSASNQMASVKQEEENTTSDISGSQITHDDLCRKHNKPFEYIHRPHEASSTRKFKGKKIHLKPGKYILRGEPGIDHLDEFSRHIVWGNPVKLYNHNVLRL
ncbi:hypothetical protein ACQJBY_009490 [Aegilops geniculata]